MVQAEDPIDRNRAWESIRDWRTSPQLIHGPPGRCCAEAFIQRLAQRIDSDAIGELVDIQFHPRLACHQLHNNVGTRGSHKRISTAEKRALP
jgi:hypothetical protein